MTAITKVFDFIGTTASLAGVIPLWYVQYGINTHKGVLYCACGYAARYEMRV